MQLNLRYGRTGMPIDLAEDLDVEVLHLNPLPALTESNQALDESLRNPIGCASLDRIAAGRESACIVISDVTRPVPNEPILQSMLACLHDSGIPRHKVTILVATGLHRPNIGPELEEMVGSEIMENYSIVNHAARNKDEQTSIGEVPMFINGDSARVAIDNAYLQSDLKITTGLIEPHLIAGYSGGRKLVCPGIASAETIMQFHSAPMIGHPRSVAGNLQENPVHAMSRAVAGVTGVDFICNVTLSEDRKITGVFSGDLDAAHTAGIAHVDRQTKVPCRPADIVITTSAGYPLDTTLYQVVKGMVGAVSAIKPGGTMIVAASLSEGLGSPEFAAMCGTLRSADEFIERVYNSDVIIDQWQLQGMMMVLQKCEVMIVSDGLSAAVLRDCLLTPMASVREALAAALKKHGSGAAITVIPEGPYVTPVPNGNGQVVSAN